MNWVTTNIRLPEKDYLELKMEALKRRISLAQLFREKVIKKRKKKTKSTDKIMNELAKLAKENAKYFKGLDTTQLLREIRKES